MFDDVTQPCTHADAEFLLLREKGMNPSFQPSLMIAFYCARPSNFQNEKRRKSSAEGHQSHTSDPHLFIYYLASYKSTPACLHSRSVSFVRYKLNFLFGNMISCNQKIMHFCRLESDHGRCWQVERGCSLES